MKTRLARWVLCVGLLAVVAGGGCDRSPSGVVFHADENPESLSEWGLLRIEHGRLRSNPGNEPYTLNTALFTDHAHKFRTIWVPPGAAAKYHPSEAFDFPVGSIISKTFYYPKASEAEGERLHVRLAPELPEESRAGIDLKRMRLIETRLLVRRKEGWVALPYVWDAEQTDARLARVGESLQMTMHRAEGDSRAFDYIVPDQNQCASCHADNSNKREIHPIGLKARHLNRDDPWNPGRNQLASMVDDGRLVGLAAGRNATVPRNARFDDPKAGVDAKARAYLDINCGHCHSANGPADTSGLWLDIATSDATRLGLCKSPIAAGRGTGGRMYDLVPGKPDESILIYRMETDDPGERMPEIGRSLAHEDGIELLRAWISSWPGPGCDGDAEQAESDVRS